MWICIFYFVIGLVVALVYHHEIAKEHNEYMTQVYTAAAILTGSLWPFVAPVSFGALFYKRFRAET